MSLAAVSTGIELWLSSLSYKLACNLEREQSSFGPRRMPSATEMGIVCRGAVVVTVTGASPHLTQQELTSSEVRTARRPN